MPLQNRVTPFGEIVAIPERGTFLGNRGILHDDRKQIVRFTQVRRWLCCVLSFKGIHRIVMKPHSYTELFFLDEATALAAGHRPCFECRRQSALEFQAAWERAFGIRASADDMDRALDGERRLPRSRTKRTYQARGRELPDGAMVTRDGAAWLVHRGELSRWTPVGYDRTSRLGSGLVDVLTPRSTIAVLTAGYRPALHGSAMLCDMT